MPKRVRKPRSDGPPALRTVVLPLAELTEDPHNARSHNARNLEVVGASLARFGQVERIVVRTATKQIIGGHARAASRRTTGTAP